MDNPKIVHVKNITSNLNDLRDRLSFICQKHELEIVSQIKDTFVMTYKSDSDLTKLYDLKDKLNEVYSHKIVIIKEGL